MYEESVGLNEPIGELFVIEKCSWRSPLYSPGGTPTKCQVKNLIENEALEKD